MKKTLYYCDTCREETEKSKLEHFLGFDICKFCQTKIINKVIEDKLLVLLPWCLVCEGKGYVRELIGIDYGGREYNNKKCKDCEL